MNRPLLFMLASIFVLGACSQIMNTGKEELSLEKDFSRIKIMDEYSMMIPNYMKKTTALNDDASLQFQNIYKETYVIVIDEPKTEFVETFQMLGEYNDTLSVVKNYRDIQLSYMKEGLSVINESTPVSSDINGLFAEQVMIQAGVPDIIYDIAYFFTFIEGDDKLYMIMAWTLDSSRDKYEDTFAKMAGSFKLLGSSNSSSL